MVESSSPGMMMTSTQCDSKLIHQPVVISSIKAGGFIGAGVDVMLNFATHESIEAALEPH